MHILIRIGAICLALTGVVACQSSEGGVSYVERSEQEVQEALAHMGLERGEVVDRISDFRIRGWNAINDSHLILTAPRHRHYLVTLASPCEELRFAFTVGVETDGGTIRRFDAIRVNSLHGPYHACLIEEIRELKDIDANDG